MWKNLDDLGNVVATLIKFAIDFVIEGRCKSRPAVDRGADTGGWSHTVWSDHRCGGTGRVVQDDERSV